MRRNARRYSARKGIAIGHEHASVPSVPKRLVRLAAPDRTLLGMQILKDGHAAAIFELHSFR